MAIENNPSMATSQAQADGNFGIGDKSMEVAMATKMQLVLDQPMTDVSTGLVNKDFEGDFFKIGDTVSIVKPDPSSLVIDFGAINTGNASGQNAKDAKLTPAEVTFEKQILTIDKYVKYAFVISDITKAEGKWNYESGNLDLTAQEIRKRHNRETLKLILEDNGVASVTGTASNPTDLTSGLGQDEKVGDRIYEQVIVPMFTKLYNGGAITADGQITYGSNSQEGKATHACLYVPTAVYTALLLSKYLQDRATVAADEKVATGKVKTVMGFDIMIEPSLDENANHPVEVSNLADGALCIVAGTRNLVTRAGKVLPPEKQRSQTRFADEFHGLEIYAEKVIEPLAGVKAFVTVS